ncbi:MAG: DUF2752 domain-containing protein [Clostridia bacterium]
MQIIITESSCIGYNGNMENSLSKIYRIVSMVILGLCIYFFLLPVISPLMEKLIPRVWMCPFLRLTGSECPFCGITSGLKSLYRLDTGGASILSMLAFFLVLMEVMFRTMIVFFIDGLGKKTITGLIITDAAWHTALVALTSVYAIIFIVNKFWEG